MNFISIKEALKKSKGKIALRGWVHRERGSNAFKFIVLRDSSDIIQCVIKKENISKKEWNDADKLLRESSIELEGELKEDKRAPTGYEVQVKKLNVIHFADVFPIKDGASEEVLMDKRHLWLRSRKMTAVLKIRSTVFAAVHEYFRKNGYYEYQSPIFTPNACEGGSTLFELPYFGKKVYLTQTWQLYAEAGIFSLEKIYTIAPSFRAEKSHTSRHLTEYWHAEVETAWQNFDGLTRQAEELVKHIVRKVLETSKEELKILERDISKLQPTLKKKFPIIAYDEALKLLKEKKKMSIPWGKDLRTIEEEKLMELYDTPIIVTNYPKDIKAFYMKQDEKNKKTVKCFDMLAPEGNGEIMGASERETDIEELKRKLKAEGEKIEEYEWYLETRKFGSVPHSGFGLGIERIIKWICGLDHIKDTIPFPRTMVRFTP